jgi:hypothetical protein
LPHIIAGIEHAARRLTVKDTNEKLAHRRLTVLELAERLGNVSEACREFRVEVRQGGVSTYAVWMRSANWASKASWGSGSRDSALEWY